MLKHAKLKLVLLIYLALVLFLIVSIVLGVNIGSVNINPISTFKIIVNNTFHSNIFKSSWDTSTEAIIWNLRFPKVLVAGLVGAGLALAGIFMQVLTKNPLADPYILGISSGASTGAVLALLIGAIPFIGSVSVEAGSFAGAIITVVIVFGLSGRAWKSGTTRLVLVGMAVSALFSAVTNFIIFVTPDSHKVTSAMFWMTGSFAGVNWKNVLPAFISLLLGVLVSLCLSTRLDAMLLGEEMAKIRGVDTKKIRIIIILLSTLITGVMVSMSGIIGFVGLVIPHIGRLIMGATHHRMIPFSLLVGASFMIWADCLARTIVSPEEIPVGVITAIIGVPFFLAMMKKSKYGFGGH